VRQVLFVIAVVGAAFVGGAVVNGPGFRWAQERLLVYMGLQDGGEIASIDLPPAPGEARVAETPAVENGSTGPTVKEPEVKAASTVDPDARRAGLERRALSQGIPAPKTEPRVTEPFVETDAQKPKSPAAGESGAPALLGALAGALQQAAPPPGAADGPTKTPEPEPGSGPDAPPAPLDPSVAPALLASLASSGSDPAARDAEPKDSAPSDEAGDWADLKRKLVDEGVTRYTIEGEPGGRVVFVCLIPLAGKQAVSQRFEAEGDDEFQAARAALRRITLWRAAQAEPAK